MLCKQRGSEYDPVQSELSDTKVIKVLGFSQGSLDTNYSISLTIIEGIRNCVPFSLC